MADSDLRNFLQIRKQANLEVRPQHPSRPRIPESSGPYSRTSGGGSAPTNRQFSRPPKFKINPMTGKPFTAKTVKKMMKKKRLMMRKKLLERERKEMEEEKRLNADPIPLAEAPPSPVSLEEDERAEAERERKAQEEAEAEKKAIGEEFDDLPSDEETEKAIKKIEHDKKALEEEFDELPEDEDTPIAAKKAEEKLKNDLDQDFDDLPEDNFEKQSPHETLEAESKEEEVVGEEVEAVKIDELEEVSDTDDLDEFDVSDGLSSIGTVDSVFLEEEEDLSRRSGSRSCAGHRSPFSQISSRNDERSSSRGDARSRSRDRVHERTSFDRSRSRSQWSGGHSGRSSREGRISPTGRIGSPGRRYSREEQERNPNKSGRSQIEMEWEDLQRRRAQIEREKRELKQIEVEEANRMQQNARAVKKEKPCRGCKQLGHWIKDCPIAACNYCHEKGHLKNDCPRSSRPSEVRISNIASVPSSSYSNFSASQTKPAKFDNYESYSSLPKAPPPPSLQSLPKTKSMLMYFSEKLLSRGNASSSRADEMVLTWRLCGHTDETLCEIVDRQRPTSQVQLRLILVKELSKVDAGNIPMSVNVSELLDETVNYLLPPKNDFGGGATSLSFSTTAPPVGSFEQIPQIASFSSGRSVPNRGEMSNIQSALNSVHSLERFKQLENRIYQGNEYDGRLESMVLLRGYIAKKMLLMKDMFGISEAYISVVSATIPKLLAHVGLDQFTLLRTFGSYGQHFLEDMLKEKLNAYANDLPSGLKVNYIISTVCDYLKDTNISQ